MRSPKFQVQSSKLNALASNLEPGTWNLELETWNLKLGTMTRPVLIIEDDPDIAEGLRYNLEREGLAARVAETGEQGLQAARSEEHTSELQSRSDLVCRLLLVKKKLRKTLTLRRLPSPP